MQCLAGPVFIAQTFIHILAHSHNIGLYIAIFIGPISFADRQPRHQSLMVAVSSIASAENQHYDRTISPICLAGKVSEHLSDTV